MQALVYENDSKNVVAIVETIEKYKDMIATEYGQSVFFPSSDLDHLQEFENAQIINGRVVRIKEDAETGVDGL